MKEYLHIIQKELSFVSEMDLYLPIRETNIDSIDMVVIRVALEKYFSHEVPDAKWYQFQTLSEGLQYFHNIAVGNPRKSVSHRVELGERIEIRMPHMANSALSESWLLKYLGDFHWLLLTKGLAQKSSQFKDEAGNRLYATFVRVNYTCSSLKEFQENEILDFNGFLEGFGAQTYLSKIEAQGNTTNVTATLMSTFSFKENGNNCEMIKGSPKVTTNYVPQLLQTPIFLTDYRLLKKDLLKQYACDYGVFDLTGQYLFSCEYELNPFFDINGVGLLYFASYPSIADKCIMEYFNKENNATDFSHNYHTVFRDVFFFANCNCGDSIVFKLNTLKMESNLLKLVCCLHRKSDNTMLAKIITVKEKII